MRYDIFISYRREGGFETANLIASKLKLSGYRVFLDIHSMHSGDFSEQLKEKVKGCKDFVWVLSPTNVKNDDGTVTRIETLSFRDGVDYFRDEICWAIEYHKNIIPVILDGFIVPKEFPIIIQDTIKSFNPSCDLHTLQAVEASKNQHFDASISELKRYLHSYPVVKWILISSFIAILIALSTVFSFLFGQKSTNNCVISLIEIQQHSFQFEGGDVDLIIQGKSLGKKHIYNVDDQIVFTDISKSDFGEKAIIKFSAQGYVTHNDTIILEKNIEVRLERDDTYKCYFGHIGDSDTGLPLQGVKVIIDNITVSTDSLGYYEFNFDITKQTLSKSLSATKDGYELHEDNDVYPGTDNKFYLKRK